MVSYSTVKERGRGAVLRLFLLVVGESSGDANGTPLHNRAEALEVHIYVPHFRNYYLPTLRAEETAKCTSQKIDITGQGKDGGATRDQHAFLHWSQTQVQSERQGRGLIRSPPPAALVGGVL